MGDQQYEESRDGVEPGSMLDSLRKQYHELETRQDIMMSIPGYGGQLCAKYGLLDAREDLTKIGKRIVKQFPGNPQEQAFFGSIDVMIQANIGLYYRRDEDDYASISEALGGDQADEPITYSDSRLIEFFAWNPEEVGSARQAVVRLFKNDSALFDHGRMLSEWMRDTSKDVSQDFLARLT